MKRQWMKKAKRVAVLLLTAILLINTVDYNQLFVKAEEVVEQQEDGADENTGSDEGKNNSEEVTDGGEDSDSGEVADGGEDNGSGEVADDRKSDGSGEVADNGKSDGSGEVVDDGKSDDSGEVTDDGKTDCSGEAADDGKSDGSGDATADGNKGEGNPSADEETGTDGGETESIDSDADGSENDITVENEKQTTVDIHITVKDENGNALEGTAATVVYKDKEGNESTAVWSKDNSCYIVTISGEGKVFVTADGYEGSKQDVTMDSDTYEFTVNKIMRASWKLAADNNGRGVLADSQGKALSETFTLGSSSPVIFVVKAYEGSYIAKVAGTKTPVTITGYPDQQEIEVSDGDDVEITFKRKGVLTIGGTNLDFGEITLEGEKVQKGTNYFTPDKSKLVIEAGAMEAGRDSIRYISSVKAGETEILNPDKDGHFVSKKEIELNKVSKDGEINLSISYDVKWGSSDLQKALESNNAQLSSLPYNAEVALKIPDETYGFTMEWKLNDKTIIDGVSLSTKDGDQILHIGRKAQGQSFQLQGIASLNGEEVSTDIEAKVTGMTAKEGEDYLFTGIEVDGIKWLKEISLFQKAEGDNANSFDSYELKKSDGTKIAEGIFSETEKPELGKMEDIGAALTLKSSEVPAYKAEIEGLYIDTKGPAFTKITVYEVKSDGASEVDSGKYTGEGNTLKTKYPIAISLEAEDKGSGFASAKLIYEENGETKSITSTKVENGIATFDDLKGEVNYNFSEITLMDKVGNETSYPKNMNFSIDTEAPTAPSVGEVATDTWVQGKNHEYTLSSSKDTVKFVICEADENPDWSQIEQDVEDGKQDDSFIIISDISATDEKASAKWDRQAEDDDILIKEYQIKALDDHGNFSENFTDYLVKIDNQNPTSQNITFKKKTSGVEVTQPIASKKVNDRVEIQVPEISDGDGSGIEKAVLVGADKTETVLNLNNDSTTATLTLENNQEYAFTALKIYDKVGNCKEQELYVRFTIDTESPAKPEITVSQCDQKDENGWLRGTDCAFTITSGDHASDAYCFEIYENDEQKLTKTIIVNSDNISGKQASVEWDVPLEKEKVLHKTYKVRVRDYEDPENSNYSEFSEVVVKIDNKVPEIDKKGFYIESKEVTDPEIVTNKDVTLEFYVKDGENPPVDASGLKAVQEAVRLEYRAMEKNYENSNGDDPDNNDWKKTLTLTPDEKGKCTVTLPASDTKYIRYSDFVIIAEDNVGNVVTDTQLKQNTVEIDRRGPVIEAVEWNASSDQNTYWYNGSKESFQFYVKVSDDTRLKAVTVCLSNQNGDLLDSEGNIVAKAGAFTVDTDGNVKADGTILNVDKCDVKLNGNAGKVEDEFSGWVYDRNGKSEKQYPDKKEYYTVWVTDQFDNITIVGDKKEDISKDKAPKEVRIDLTYPVIELDEENNANVTYDFSNVKQPNSKEVKNSALGDSLVNGKLLSKENIMIHVQAYDPMKNPNNVNPKGVASGIVKAELAFLKNGEKQLLSIEPEEPELDNSYEFQLAGMAGQETEFVLETITLTDLAGNKNIYYYKDGDLEHNCLGSLTAVVDQKQPTAAFQADAYSYTYPEKEDITGWYSAAGKAPLKLTATAEDGYGIYTVQWYKSSQKKGTDVTDQDKLEAVPDQNAKEDEETFQSVREFKEDQNQLYVIKVTDWAGNELVYCADRADNVGSRVRIDNVAPDNTAFISWTDGDSNGSGANDIVKKGEEYEASSKDGMVFNRTRVTLHVYVRDINLSVKELLDGENGRVSSGIQKVDVTVNLDHKGEKLETGINDRNVALVEIKGEEYLDFSFDINLTNSKAEIENFIDSIVIYDNAGNQTPGEAEVLRDKVKYILDDLNPELTVDYHSGNYVENALFPDTYFYDKDPGINAMIRERYFFTEDVKMQLSVPEATEVMDHSGWNESGVEHGSVFSAPGDGKYRFSIEYADRSGNEMIGENVEGGSFTSKTLVMDTTVPKIDITYEYNGHDVTDEIYDGNFFAGTVTATVRITEMNFDPDQVEIEAVGKASESNSGIGISWDGAWTQEGSDVQVNRVTFDQQGTYQFTCTCRDIVGHEAEKPAQSHFVVDTTKPEVEITYDLNDPMNEKYYKETRTATIRVTDRSFDPDQTEFMMESSGPKPLIGEWVHVAGGGCENQPTYHVDHCVYEAKIVYAEDGDYSLGFRCTDKAGNQSEMVMTDPFTVDQTLPEMTVTYDNNDVRNDRYYNAKRIGTIRITEHNFNPEDVKIITSAQNAGAGMNAPGIGGWRNEGDVHTASIVYDYDAEFSFDISYTDMAGNEAETYAGDQFVVDMTAPVLEITDIEDKSANNDTVAPGITYSDVNLDTNGVALALTGANNGETVVDTTVTSIAGGLKIQYHDFPHKKELDDLYTFHATVTDLAGNVSEQTVLFSVNRFGSVYVFDTATQEILDNYYINRPAHLNVTEINVDSLEFKEITYSKNGDIETMKAGDDYTVTQSGSDVTWKSYTYDISDKNFTEEGAYTVTIYSEDRATNKSNNIVKEKNIDFVMDVTAPTVVVTGVEDREQYNENSRVVTIDAKDNIYLAGVTAYLDDKPVKTYDTDALAENGGVVTMEIENSNEWQKLYVKAVDAAGNEGISDTRTFLVTKNLLIQWYRNVPLFWGSIAGMAAIAVLIIIFLFYKKKKADDKAA